MSQELTKIERLKQSSHGLRGKIKEELKDPEAKRFTNDSEQLLKFHGMYQQKDRDRRAPAERKLGPKPFTLMIRGRIPGGRLSPESWRVWDDLASAYSSGGIRLTTRQSIQLHGVLKSQVEDSIKKIHQSLQTTTGACGDVVRNVTQAVNPWGDPKLAQLDHVAELISQHFEVRSQAYFDIFLDGESVRVDEQETIYGDRYLPRKFKIAVSAEGDNSVDIYTHDFAIVATFNDGGVIDGYHIFAGGGMGTSHNNEATFPRLADHLGWIPKKELIPISEAIVTTQRDFGNREDRSQARLKYTIAHRGVDWFRHEVSSRAGVDFEDRPLAPWKTRSPLGWFDQANGKKALGLHLLSGRIIDQPNRKLKSALRQIIDHYVTQVQITAEQDLILEGIDPEKQIEVETILDQNGISPFSPNRIFDRAVTCVALPTCVKALAESERVGEATFSSIQELFDKHRQGRRAPTVRITGCPNGCARPYAAEIGLVGQLPGKYALFLGGSQEGTRLAKKIGDKLKLDDIYRYLDFAFSQWSKQGEPTEDFGDFVDRVGLANLKPIEEGLE
ncbi:NADPH-dependent assimilatory sulfite reductase hemoprotein subunit [Pseudobacteriovorax antillogorgiicola]|uniref:Sulfite reductase (NADPH) beta subunit n=1 Tax=Pseudobacteriovorax antillogorgiicola TaxID=1513793 RepID=A0A1Y6CUJ1_9BACT|nr:NADPH-dependent assimilatory sulfite reductase hemoprotein subunit [Pseudobacteriovorax antillogorgiicola]TCS44593.1 sulfite reductase (NADPH) beta subunit [Pseudobacteriovorax antillogorgiicola]SMF78117.1 sulfite reductase (NADPH) beta subunit [Pseudobacteriovorax antillogorgiicola]